MSTSNSMSSLEPLIPSTTNGLYTSSSGGDRSHSPDNDRNLCVTLDDRGNNASCFCSVNSLIIVVLDLVPVLFSSSIPERLIPISDFLKI